VRPPRGLSAEEAEAWAKVSQTVKPLTPARVTPAKVLPLRSVEAVRPPVPQSSRADLERALAAAKTAARLRPSPGPNVSVQAAPRTAPPAPAGLDSHWDRRFRAGTIDPDFTLDLHGHTLDQAHDRLDSGLAQARAMGARVVLVIAGKPRPVDAADRGTKRGAIRAKLLDWLAAGPHGSSVAAVRGAHRRHGGEGALYLVLKRGG
jgi:DNA-nicking Smr family endonuclease